MDLRAWCVKHHKSTAEFCEYIHPIAPKFSKIQFSMVCNRDYGVTLRPSLAQYMREPENRVNPCRVQFRVTPAQKERLTQLKELLDVPTIQDVMICVLKVFFAQLDKERAAALSGTEDSGNEKDVT